MSLLTPWTNWTNIIGMKTVNVHEAKTNFSSLLARVEKDSASIVICRNGEPIADSAYGAVVIGGEESVKQKVRAAGSDAVIHRVAPFITAIFCKPDSPQMATVSHD